MVSAEPFWKFWARAGTARSDEARERRRRRCAAECLRMGTSVRDAARRAPGLLRPVGGRRNRLPRAPLAARVWGPPRATGAALGPVGDPIVETTRAPTQAAEVRGRGPRQPGDGRPDRVARTVDAEHRGVHHQVEGGGVREVRVEVLHEERLPVGLDRRDAAARLALGQPLVLHHRPDPRLERCHHEDAQRLALAEDEVRPAPEDDGPAVVREGSHHARQVVAELHRAQVAAAGDRGQPVREHLRSFSSDDTTRSLRCVLSAIRWMISRSKRSSPRVLGQPPRDLAAFGAVLPRDGHDRPPRLLAPLLADELPAVRLLLDQRLDRACHGLPPRERRHPKGGPCQGYTCARGPDRAPVAGRSRARGRLRRRRAGRSHRATFRLPVSNDDAILLLMGRHVLRGELATTLWNQPYNGALDAYLLAPLLAVLPHHPAYRLYELAVRRAARRPRRAAGAPPRRAGRRLGRGAPRRLGDAVHGPDDGHGPAAELPDAARHRLSAAGGAGRAAAAGGAPARAGRGPRPRARLRPRRLELLARDPGLRRDGGGARARPACGRGAGRSLAFAAGSALGAAPLVVARADRGLGREGGDGVERGDRRSGRSWLWGQGVARPRPRAAGPRRPAGAAGGGRQGAGRAARSRSSSLSRGGPARRARRRRAARAARCRSLGWAAALAGAFWLSRRTGPDELRYLYGLNAPAPRAGGAGLAAPLGLAPARGGAAGAGPPRALGLRPARAGRDAGATRPTPSACGRCRASQPPLDALRAAGDAQRLREPPVRRPPHARGARGGDREPGLERAHPGRPAALPRRGGPRPRAGVGALDALLARHAARRRLPRARCAGDGRLVRGDGRSAGSWCSTGSGPPYDEGAARAGRAGSPRDDRRARPLGAAALDRDPRDRVDGGRGARPRERRRRARLGRPRRLSALVLALDLEASPLAVPWAASIGGRGRGAGAGACRVPVGERRAARGQAGAAGGAARRTGRRTRCGWCSRGRARDSRSRRCSSTGPDEAARPPAGAEPARGAFESARAGRWDEAVRLYAQAVRLEPDRASHHAAWARARWRAGPAALARRREPGRRRPRAGRACGDATLTTS